jgi:hypothetical protein
LQRILQTLEPKRLAARPFEGRTLLIRADDDVGVLAVGHDQGIPVQDDI